MLEVRADVALRLYVHTVWTMLVSQGTYYVFVVREDATMLCKGM